MEYDNEDYNLADAIQDVLLYSPYSPRITNIIYNELRKYSDNSILLITDSDEAMRDLVYHGPDVGKKYAILAFTYLDHDYLYFVLNSSVFATRGISAEAIRLYKQEGNYSSPREMGAFLSGEHARFFALLHELLEKSVRSRRGAIPDPTKAQYDYPSAATLREFYECGRKVSYPTQQEASQHRLIVQDKEYQCLWDSSHWHMGKEPTGDNIPDDVKLNRWRTAWRRKND